MTQARADPHGHAAKGDWLGAVGWGLYLEVSLMATATVGVVPAKSPANSGEIPRRRRGYDEDRDDEAVALVWSTRVGVVRVDGVVRSEKLRVRRGSDVVGVDAAECQKERDVAR